MIEKFVNYFRLEFLRLTRNGGEIIIFSKISFLVFNLIIFVSPLFIFPKLKSYLIDHVPFNLLIIPVLLCFVSQNIFKKYAITNSKFLFLINCSKLEIYSIYLISSLLELGCLTGILFFFIINSILSSPTLFLFNFFLFLFFLSFSLLIKTLVILKSNKNSFKGRVYSMFSYSIFSLGLFSFYKFYDVKNLFLFTAITFPIVVFTLFSKKIIIRYWFTLLSQND
jgi:hypothetical protein